MNDEDSLEMAKKYQCKLSTPEVCPIIQYRTDRGATYGVKVNTGEKVIVWNAYTEKLESYPAREFNNRFMISLIS